MYNNDYEYRYFYEDGKLKRFHIGYDENTPNPRNNEWYRYFTNLYVDSKNFYCIDDRLKDIRNNEDAIRLMIKDSGTDVVQAVCDGKFENMTIKYDFKEQEYELYVDDYEEEESCYKEWLEDTIIENIRYDDMSGISDNLIVIPLVFTTNGYIEECGWPRSEPDGFIWTTLDDMKANTGYKFETDKEWKDRAYQYLYDEIEEVGAWAVGDNYCYVIDVCTDTVNKDNEDYWEYEDSCFGYTVPFYKAEDEIYEDAKGSTPYHTDLIGFECWPEVRNSNESEVA